MHKIAQRVVRTLCALAGVAVIWGVFHQADYLTTKENAKAARSRAQVAVSQTTNFGRIITDGDGKIIAWNRGMVDTTGWKADDVLGKPIESFLAAGASDTPVGRALLEGGSGEGNLAIRTAGSKHQTVLIKAKVNTASQFRYVIADPVGQLNSL